MRSHSGFLPTGFECFGPRQSGSPCMMKGIVTAGVVRSPKPGGACPHTSFVWPFLWAEPLEAHRTLGVSLSRGCRPPGTRVAKGRGCCPLHRVSLAVGTAPAYPQIPGHVWLGPRCSPGCLIPPNRLRASYCTGVSLVCQCGAELCCGRLGTPVLWCVVLWSAW